MSKALASLIEPISLDEFFQSYWEKQPLLSRHGPKKYEDLFSMETVDEMVSFRDLSGSETFRLIRRGEGLTGPKPSLIYDEYADGATLVLQKLDSIHPPLFELCQEIEQELGIPAQVNGYLTPPETFGFNPHFDDHDVLILHVSGKKTWHLWDQAMLLPLSREVFKAYGRMDEYQDLLVEIAKRQDAPSRTIVMEAGDFLYLPRGWVHHAETLEGHSLHLTMGLATYRAYDVVERALRRALESVEERATTVVIGDPGPALTEAWRMLWEQVDVERARAEIRRDVAVRRGTLPRGIFTRSFRST